MFFRAFFAFLNRALAVRNADSLGRYRIQTMKNLSLLIATVMFLFPNLAFSAGGSQDGESLGLVSAIGLAIVSAAALAVVFHALKIPSLLAYILSGLLLGMFASPLLSHSIETMTHISHLGLVFLLFIIGLEMDIGGILHLGRRAALAVLLQAPITIAVVLGLQYGAAALGFSVFGLGTNPSSFIFFAVAASLGSTAVVVKLLGDKYDLDSKAGRLTVLTLIAEDIWAVLALSYVLTRDGHAGEETSILMMIGGGISLTVLFYLFTKHLLSRIMGRFSKSPDMLALIALGWCFLCAESLSRIGLSSEMGALIAGLTIGMLPHHVEILAKVSSLRDFFMALFFVALGMTLPLPSLAIMGQALALVGIVVLTRMILFTPTLLWAKNGFIVSLTSAVNLAQLSEFTLLLIPVGLATGSLSTEEGMVISYALMLSVVLSGFSIKYNYNAAGFMARFLRRDFRVIKEHSEDEGEGPPGRHHDARLFHQRRSLRFGTQTTSAGTGATDPGY